jgi:glycosyltransferase involved in cell wall biosynthesis
MSNLPAVVVLMAAYNAAQYIERSLDSIVAQTYEQLKLILVDDGSTDSTMSLIVNYVRNHADLQSRIVIKENAVNQGIARTRSTLLALAKEADHSAYFLWLDADDEFIGSDAVSSIVTQMIKVQADICVFNFDVVYESSSDIANSAGLLADKERHVQILQEISESREGYVSPIEIQAMNITSLGWTKCYAPSIVLPEPEMYPFEDFVFMAAILKAKRLTSLPPSIPIIRYLRRSTSYCGRRTVDNFLLHIPKQLSRFYQVVGEDKPSDPSNEKRLTMAKAFVIKKLHQYETTLTSLVQSQQYAEFNEDIIQKYKELMMEMKHQK